MSNITNLNFNFNSNAIRSFVDDKNEAWFCASDVCNVLGYKNAPDAIAKHCREWGIAKRDTPTESGVQSMLHINEGNVYRLITKSRKPEAQEFERNLFEVILPSIRKTGSYTATISPKQQYLLKEAATVKAAASRKTHQAVWREFYQAFEIPKYQDLPASQFEQALAFLNGERLLNKPQTAKPVQHIQPDQERIGQAFALAAEVGNKVSRTVFEGLIAGNDDLMFSRWVFSLNTDQSGNFNPQVKPIKHNAVIAPLAELPRYLLDSGLNISNKELANLAIACSQRLAERMTLESNKEMALTSSTGV